MEGSAEVGLTMNSREFRAQAKAAVRNGVRVSRHSRRPSVATFATATWPPRGSGRDLFPSKKSSLPKAGRSGSSSDSDSPRNSSVPHTPAIQRDWLATRVVSSWAALGVRASQSRTLGSPSSREWVKRRSAASRQSKRRVRGLWHTEAR